MGNALLAAGRDVTLRDLQSALPPLVLVNGFDFNDPIQCTTHGAKPGCKAYSYPGGVHTFIGSRSSTADIVVDTLGSDVMSEGHPSMNQFVHKYGLSDAIFKDAIEPTGQLEGLWGDHLPIFSYWWPMKAGGWIEYTAVPVADMHGSMEQDAYWRVQKLAANGTVIKAQYYDNYAYTAGAFQGPDQVPASGEPPNSIIANEFYAAVLEQRQFWEDEFEREGLFRLSLPPSTQTDGVTLQSMLHHGIIRDMITRKNTFFPKYGVLPNGYAMPEADGFPQTFIASMTMALETGAMQYAEGVLANWLQYYGEHWHTLPRLSSVCALMMSVAYGGSTVASAALLCPLRHLCF
jgi:hypothetical protein